MAKGKTAQVRRGEARLYLDKAVQFIEQARSGLDADRNDAALLDAIHAAISATDAATIALAGVRSTDPDHQRSADLLEEVAASAPEGRERARQLRAPACTKEHGGIRIQESQRKRRARRRPTGRPNRGLG